MGFFDKMSALLDTKKWYTEEDLEIYFKNEIEGVCNYYIGKKEITTNISKIISEFLKEKYTNPNAWAAENASSRLEKINETVYKITYKGKIVRIKNAYGDSLDDMHYDVVVYANKYAELVSGEDYKTTVRVW